MTTPELIWIAPRWPIPPNDGAKVATFSLLQGLVKRGFSIHFISLPALGDFPNPQSLEGAQEVLVQSLGLKSVQIYLRNTQSRKKFIGLLKIILHFFRHPLTPITMQSFSDRSLDLKLRSAITKIGSDRTAPFKPNSAKQGPANQGSEKNQPLPWIVYDGLHVAAHTIRLGKFRTIHPSFKIIYRAHNFESELWTQRAKRSRWSPLSFFFKFQGTLVKIFEQSLSESSTAVAPVSLSDWQKFKSDLPGITGRVVPIGYEFVKPLTFTHNKPWRLLFLGRLDWPPNREGLIWFITKVWSKLKDSSQFELIVAGSGENEWLKRLLVSQKGHPIRFLGVIENLAKCYEDCHLSLIPIFSGSGTRVKVIEASRYGRACLSTGLGVEGCGLSPGQSYLGAETADEWLLQLEQFDSNKIEQIGRNAFDQLKGVFDQNQSSQIFSELIA